MSDSFASRIATLRNFLRIERGLRQNLLDEIQGMTLAIEELEAWIASRTAWPIKVTERCCEFRNQRIGVSGPLGASAFTTTAMPLSPSPIALLADRP